MASHEDETYAEDEFNLPGPPAADELEIDGDTLFSRPLRIRKVKVIGNNRTHVSVLERELQDAYMASNVRDVSEGLATGLQSINRLGIFESVAVECDAVPGSHDETDVTFTVIEKGLIQFKAQTYVEGGEGGMEVSSTLRNAAGMGEMVDAKVGTGSQSSQNFQVDIRKPRFGGFPIMGTAAASSDTHNFEKTSSYSLVSNGGFLKLASYDGLHELAYTASWRDVMPSRQHPIPFRRRDSEVSTASNENEGSSTDYSTPVDPYLYAASSAVLLEAHPSFKSSLTYALNVDKRDNPICPTRGGLFRVQSELAGLAGDVGFSKTQFTFQRYRSPFANSDSQVVNWYDQAVLGLTFNCGLLFPFSGPLVGGPSGVLDAKADAEVEKPSSMIPDRFFLGGPLSFRGFHTRGAGPRGTDGGLAGGDAIGGDVTWRLGASASVPLIASLRAQVFANAGNLVAFKDCSVRNLTRGCRAAVGVGLVLPTPVGRFEATVSHVLRASENDQTRRFQLGVGMDFL